MTLAAYGYGVDVPIQIGRQAECREQRPTAIDNLQRHLRIGLRHDEFVSRLIRYQIADGEMPPLARLATQWIGNVEEVDRPPVRKAEYTEHTAGAALADDHLGTWQLVENVPDPDLHTARGQSSFEGLELDDGEGVVSAQYAHHSVLLRTVIADEDLLAGVLRDHVTDGEALYRHRRSTPRGHRSTQ